MAGQMIDPDRTIGEAARGIGRRLGHRTTGGDGGVADIGQAIAEDQDATDRCRRYCILSADDGTNFSSDVRTLNYCGRYVLPRVRKPAVAVVSAALPT